MYHLNRPKISICKQNKKQLKMVFPDYIQSRSKAKVTKQPHLKGLIHMCMCITFEVVTTQ